MQDKILDKADEVCSLIQTIPGRAGFPDRWEFDFPQDISPKKYTIKICTLGCNDYVMYLYDLTTNERLAIGSTRTYDKKYEVRKGQEDKVTFISRETIKEKLNDIEILLAINIIKTETILQIEKLEHEHKNELVNDKKRVIARERMIKDLGSLIKYAKNN